MSGILISFRIFQFIVIHTVKGFGTVNKAEIDVFLEFSCFFDDPADVGNWEAAKRSYPMSEVRAAAESARLRQHGNSREELPSVRG